MSSTYSNRQSKKSAVLVRMLKKNEFPIAYKIIRQLRTQLSLDEFLSRTERQQTNGYEIFGAFQGEALLGILGMRPVETLARGSHLHIDDLVVEDKEKRSGVGRKLMEYAEAYAQKHQLSAVFLDSREEVRPFYETLGYSPHTSILMRKRF